MLSDKIELANGIEKLKKGIIRIKYIMYITKFSGLNFFLKNFKKKITENDPIKIWNIFKKNLKYSKLKNWKISIKLGYKKGLLE